MITSIDSNVMVGLWNPDDALNHWSRKALDAAFVSGGLTVCGAVYGELLAGPHRSEKFVDDFSTAPISRSTGRVMKRFGEPLV